MSRRPHAAGRRGWMPLALCLVVAGALVAGVCSTVVVPLGSSGPHPAAVLTGSVSGPFTAFSPGELWGGGNPAEQCTTCSATTLLAKDSAASIGSGDPVDPATGDFTTSATLVSTPSTAGTFGLSLTYDSERSISEGLDPSAYPYADPGPFGWGWQSSLTVSLYDSGTVFKVNEANGSQISFVAMTTGNSCPEGAYPYIQKYTVPGSTTPFCAARRVDAQLGIDTSLGTYQLNMSGGQEIDVFDYFGQLVQDGTLANTDGVTLHYGVHPDDTGCPGGTACTIEVDEAAAAAGVTRRIVAEEDGFGIVTSVYDPMGAEYVLTYDGDAQLTSIRNPTGDTTHYGYATTLSNVYDNEMTSITDPDGNETQIAYSNGMAAVLDRPGSKYTFYSYSNTNCATFVGCVGSDTAQTTTVLYPDGEYDVDRYQGGVLLANCYGPRTDTCNTGVDWGFNYTYSTGVGTTTEQVNMPGGGDAVVTTDATGNLSSYTDPAGNTTHYLYDDAIGENLDELCWKAPAGVLTIGATCTDPPAGAATATYDLAGTVVSATDPMGNTTHNGYYANGALCWTAPPSVTGGGSCPGDGALPSGAPAGATTYIYGVTGQVSETSVAGGTAATQTTTTEYNLDGWATATIPPDGQGHGAFGSNPYETLTGYSVAGRVVTTTAPMDEVTSYTYDTDGNVLTETDPAGVTTTTYDAFDRACWSYRGTAKVTDPTCASPPAGATSTTYLATTSAPVTVTDPTGQTTTDTYGDPAYPTEATVVTDPMDHQVAYTTYTPYGQACIAGPVDPGAASCTSAVHGDTWTDDDTEGRVLAATDASGTTTSYAYWNADYPTQPTTVVYAGRTTDYTYDADGLETAATDQEGHVVSTAYDQDGQICWSGPVSSTAPCTAPPSGKGVTTLAYDAAGETTTTVDNHGTAAAKTDTDTYDHDGNLVSATTDNGRTTAYAYNDAGAVACVAYPVKTGADCTDAPSATNTVVTRAYNGAGELSSTTDWLGNTVSYGDYTAKGEVGEVTYPSSTGESLSYHYDKAGQVTQADYAGPALGSVADSYTHNDDAEESSASGLDGFSSPADTYTDYGRVAKATSPTAPSSSVTDTYTYDPDGTLASTTPTSGPTQDDTYNAQEELTSQSQPVTTGTTTTPKAGQPISVGTEPEAVAVNPAGTKAYVADYGSGTLVPVTLAAHTKGTAITVGTDPDAVAINPGGTKAYVANKGSNTVTPVTLSTGTAGTAIAVGSKPDAIAVNPAGTKAYVVNKTSGTLTPVTLANGTAGTAISVGTDPDAIAITPNGTTAYVVVEGAGGNQSPTVVPVTLSAGTKSTAVTLSAGTAPDAIAVNPAGTTAYVANSGSGTLTPITLAHGTKGSGIAVGTDPDAIAINPAGTTAYVADKGSATIASVTLSTGTKGATATVGTDPEGIALTPAGTTAYVANEGSTTLTPVTLSTTTTLTPHDAYDQDGERCWSGATAAGGSCTQAPADATSYGWNTLGQLCWSGETADTTASCTAPPAGTTTYTYSGSGLRTTETPAAGPALAFTYDTVTGGGTPLDIDDGTNAYVYGPELFGGTAPIEQVNLTTGAVSFLASAPSGVQAVFGSTGTLQEEAAYATYGAQVVQAGTKVTPFGFQGSYTTASGLIYLVNRYYTATTAQFLSVDPDLAQTHQPYAYTGDDPLNATDPLGLEWFWVNTTWYTYWSGSPKAQAHGLECGTALGYGGNETTWDHCGSRYCSGDGPCTTHAAKAFDNAIYDAQYQAFMIGWNNAVAIQYLDAVYDLANQDGPPVPPLIGPPVPPLIGPPDASQRAAELSGLGGGEKAEDPTGTFGWTGVEENAESAGSCLDGAEGAVDDEAQNGSWITGIWGVSQMIPGFDVLADGAAIIGTAGNAVYGCLTG